MTSPTSRTRRVPPAEVPDVELYHPHSWWTKYVFSQDAKIIAIQYSGTAIAIGLVALVLSWLMRLQLGFPGTFDFITPEAYYQFITMHGMIMVIYLLTALFLGGFGNYLIPLMVGARDMVFPYVNMLSYWIYLLAVLVLVASFFAPGGPTGAGWTLYPPQAILSGTPGGQSAGIILMLVSLILFIIGFTMGGPQLRGDRAAGPRPRHDADAHAADGLGHLHRHGDGAARLPGAVRRLRDDALRPAARHLASSCRRWSRWASSSSYGGGSPILFQHLFWFFGHPEVYIVALPAFGIVSDLISTHARKNIFGYRMMVWAIVIIGALSFVVWAHHMYVSGMHPYFGFFFATTTLIIAVPTAIKVYNWVLTLWRGDIHLTIPMLFALAFIVTFVNGGLTGLFLGNVVVDVPLSRHHVRGGALPHGDGRRADHGDLRRDLPLVPQDHRPDAERGDGPVPLLGHLRRRLRDLLPDALRRARRRAAALSRARRPGLHHHPGRRAERLHQRRRADRRLRADGVPVQPLLEPPPRPRRRRQPLAGDLARMADAGDPAARTATGARELPVVYRWAYDYSVPGAPQDFIAQNDPWPNRGRPA